MFKNNKKNVKIVALAIAAAFLFGVAGIAVTQTTHVASAAPASNVGVVNYQMLVQQHPGLAAVQATMTTESENAKKEFDAKAASLGDKEKQEYYMQLQQRLRELLPSRPCFQSLDDRRAFAQFQSSGQDWRHHIELNHPKPHPKCALSSQSAQHFVLAILQLLLR